MSGSPIGHGVRVACGLMGVLFLALGGLSLFVADDPVAIPVFLTAAALFLLPALLAGPRDPGVPAARVAQRAKRLFTAARVLGGASSLGLLAVALASRTGTDVPSHSPLVLALAIAYILAWFLRVFGIYYSEQSAEDTL